jgi:hypothetical protein
LETLYQIDRAVRSEARKAKKYRHAEYKLTGQIVLAGVWLVGRPVGGAVTR